MDGDGRLFGGKIRFCMDYVKKYNKNNSRKVKDLEKEHLFDLESYNSIEMKLYEETAKQNCRNDGNRNIGICVNIIINDDND